MDRSENQNPMIEVLRIKPINHGQVNTFQIAIPEADRQEISPERRELLQSTLMEQGCNLIPLIVRQTDAYREEEEYEVVYGTDWCQVAKELDVERLWVWVFDMTDEEVAIAKAEMEQLALPNGQPMKEIMPSLTGDINPMQNLWQQIESSLQKKVETLTRKVEESAKSNEESMKKQVKALTIPKSDSDQVEQLKAMLAKLEQTVTAQVDTLAKQVGQSAKSNLSPLTVEVNSTGMIKQLDEMERLIEKKLARTVNMIGQYVTECFNSIESELIEQLVVIREEISNSNTTSKSKAKVQADDETPAPKATTKSTKATAAKSSLGKTTTKSTTTKSTTPAKATATKAATTAKTATAKTTTKATGTKAAATKTATKPSSAKANTTKATTKSTVSKTTTKAKGTTKSPATKGSSSKTASSSSPDDYDNMSLRKLKQLGKDRKLPRYARMKKPEIVEALKEADSNL